MNLRSTAQGFRRVVVLSLCLFCIVGIRLGVAQFLPEDQPFVEYEDDDDVMTHVEPPAKSRVPDGDHEYVHLESDYEYPNTRNDFKLPGSGSMFSQLPDCTDEEPVAEGGQNNVLVSTLDGDITSLDLATGAVLWRNSLGHQALFSASSSGLEVVTAGKAVELVPTLDGMLYQVSKGNKLTALPVSADALRSSTYKFDEETYVTAGYSSEAYGLYAGSGSLVYKCDQDGCKKRTTADGIVPAVSDSDDVLLVTKTIRNVHAFDPILGIQKFNYSVGEHQVELVRSGGCRASTGRKSTPSAEPGSPVLRFSLSENFMQAERPDGSRLWTKKFKHAISGAWRLQNGELMKLDLLEPRNLYQLVPLHSSAPHTNVMMSPDMYVGMVGQQKYVQQSDRLRMRLHAFAVANALRRTNVFKIDGQVFERPSISWQPYLAKPPSRALPGRRNDQRLALEYHPDTADAPPPGDLEDVFGSERLDGEAETRPGPIGHVEDKDLVALDGPSRPNFGVYLFLNDVMIGDETPAIEGPANNRSSSGHHDQQQPPNVEPAPAPHLIWEFWGLFCSIFHWTVNLSCKMRLSAVMVQLVLLVVCLMLGVRVFSKPWCDWLVTFVLAPVVTLMALGSKWWQRWRQGPPSPEVEDLPINTPKGQSFPTDFYATSEHQQSPLLPLSANTHSCSHTPETAAVVHSPSLFTDPSADHINIGVDKNLAKFFSPENNNSPVTGDLNEASNNMDQMPANKLVESAPDGEKKADSNATLASSPPISVPVGTPSTQLTSTPPTFINQQSVSSTDSKGECGALPSSRLDEFEIRGILGWGGFGVVFKAYVELDDNEYALKRIPLSNKEHHINRVIREARVLAKLNHQNIVRYNVCWTQTHSAEFIQQFDERWKRMMDKEKLPFSYQSPDAYTSPPHTDQPTSVDQSAVPSLGGNVLTRSPNVPSKVIAREGNVPLENPFARGRNATPATTNAQSDRVSVSKLPNESSFSVNFEDSFIQFKENSQSESDWRDHDSNNYLAKESDISEESNSDEKSDDDFSSKSSGDDDDAANEDSFRIDFQDDSASGVRSGSDLNSQLLTNEGLSAVDLSKARQDEASNSDRSLSGFMVLEERSRKNSSAGASSVPEQRAQDEEDPNLDQGNGRGVVRPESLHLSGDAAQAEDAKKAKEPQQSRAYLYIQMELCDTKTLKEWLLRNTERPKSKVLKFFLDIVNAVEHIHDMHMMHRDLKPSNIFFSLYQEDVLKVGDLGLVTHIAEDDSLATHDARTPMSPSDDQGPTVAGRQQKQHTAFAGTTTYMSPEQLRKEEYDYKVDIYSMGLILFEMLWAMRTDSERVHVLGKVRELQFPDGFKEAHPEEYDLLQLMLHADPQKRPTTRGIRARPPLRKMQLPLELENIKESEHFQLVKKHRRNTSSTSNHDVAEALAAAT